MIWRTIHRLIVLVVMVVGLDVSTHDVVPRIMAIRPDTKNVIFRYRRTRMNMAHSVQTTVTQQRVPGPSCVGTIRVYAILSRGLGKYVMVIALYIVKYYSTPLDKSMRPDDLRDPRDAAFEKLELVADASTCRGCADGECEDAISFEQIRFPACRNVVSGTCWARSTVLRSFAPLIDHVDSRLIFSQFWQHLYVFERRSNTCGHGRGVCGIRI